MAIVDFPKNMKASSALGASLVVKDAPTTYYGAAVRIDSTAPSATYYIQSLDASSLPSNGAVAHIVGDAKVIHTNGVDDLVNIDVPEDGVAANTGITIALSTTEFTLTAAGAYMSVTWGAFS